MTVNRKTGQDTGDTLAGVLQLQRKLATMEREVAAVGTTIAYLKAQQQNIADNYPDDAAETAARLEEVKQKFDELNDAVRKREEKLGQAGHVQTFMRDVADFQVRILGGFSGCNLFLKTKPKSACCSENMKHVQK